MASLNDVSKGSKGSQLIDLNNSEKRNDYIDYMSHLQNSAAQLRYENNVLKNDNANLVSKLDRAVSKSRNGVEIPENATTAQIAEAFEKLNEENCRLKREMERLIRSNTRYRVAMQNRDPSLIPSEEQDKSFFINSDDSGGKLCQCEYILNEILETVSYKLETYEKHIWEHRLATLTSERDEIAVQNISLVDRLAEIEAIIKVDHVLAERFNVPLEGCDEKNQILTLHRKLGFALDVNQQLERRLAFETQLSRSWQSNMHTIVSELRQYMYELGSIIKQSNSCEIFRTANTSDQAGNKGAGNIVEAGSRKADRESLKLLRLAKQRIEADTKRLETCNKRIIELENEVATLRVRNHSYIYREGAINHDAASRGIMNNILPPPKISAQDLTGGLIGSFSKTQNDNSLFSASKEGILNVKLDKVEESVDSGNNVQEKQEALQSEVQRNSSSHSQEKSKSSHHEIHDLEEGNSTHRSHHSSHHNSHHNSHRSHTQSHSSTHRSHKSGSSNDHHGSKTSKTTHSSSSNSKKDG